MHERRAASAPALGGLGGFFSGFGFTAGLTRGSRPAYRGRTSVVWPPGDHKMVMALVCTRSQRWKTRAGNAGITSSNIGRDKSFVDDLNRNKVL